MTGLRSVENPIQDAMGFPPIQLVDPFRVDR
jgi:hypothetical protein